MGLADIKRVTEKYIKDNWNTTPIFYDTQNIIGNEAVHLSFIPIAREKYSSCSIGGGRAVNRTMMKISFYAKNTLKMLELQDEMIDLLECFSKDGTYYDTAEYNAQGGNDLHNGIVEGIVLFNARTYE